MPTRDVDPDLTAGTGALLETSPGPWPGPAHHGVAEEREAPGDRPLRRRRLLPLRCELDCGRRARRAVEQTCQEWGIAEITASAMLVACELAENVIRHARSAGTLRLELHEGVFTIAVTDSDPRPPLLRLPDERRRGGRGLVLVAELSRAWGYAPRARRGKVVWAALTVPAR